MWCVRAHSQNGRELSPLLPLQRTLVRSFSPARGGGSLGSKISPASRRGAQSILLRAAASPRPPPAPLVCAWSWEITGRSPTRTHLCGEGGGDSEAGSWQYGGGSEGKPGAAPRLAVAVQAAESRRENRSSRQAAL